MSAHISAAALPLPAPAQGRNLRSRGLAFRKGGLRYARNADLAREGDERRPMLAGNAVLAPIAHARAMALEPSRNGLQPERVDQVGVPHGDEIRALSALIQARSLSSPSAAGALYVDAVSNRPDTSPAASQVRDQQAKRLTRLRERLQLSVQDAADLAGVSRHAWSRMEKGVSNLDGVAVARFAGANGLGAEYIITGGLVGLPEALVRELVQVEAAELAGVEVGTVGVPVRVPRGRKRQTRTAGRSTSAKPTEGAKN